ncbi:phage tail tape measure protein [Pseudomonas sp. TWP3-1]|uniref:phage tail tape measure protein n=1 Tax=unclassified Pseudomonas TaxID=196821 RepID=UPI003CF72EF3
MAESKYAPMNAAERGAAASGNLNLTPATANTGGGQIATDQLSGLSQALLKTSASIGLLTTAINALKLALSNLNSLSASATAKRETASEPKTSVESIDRIEPPEMLQPAIALDLAEAELKDAAHLTSRQSKEMAQTSQRTATAPMVAAGGTSGSELLKVATFAADAGIGNDLTNAADKPFELLNFAGDAAVVASAFKVPAMEVAEMMAVWRTSMKLTRDQAFDLADATNQLGKMPGDVKAADIGAVLKESGSAAIAAGMQPEQAAALSAALLGSGTNKDDAGAALKSISIGLGKGDKATVAERGAWKQLGLDPAAVATAMRDPDKQNAQGALISVFAALNAKPVEQRAALARTIFADSGDAAQLLAQNLGDVNQAFALVKDKDQYATSKLGDQGSVRQSALALSNTQQGQWNIHNARQERWATINANALSPSRNTLGAAGAGLDNLSDWAEANPKTAEILLPVAAALKILIGFVLEAGAEELKEKVGKGIFKSRSGGPPDLALSADPAARLPTDEPAMSVASQRSSATGPTNILEQTSVVNAPPLEPSIASMQPLSPAAPASEKAAFAVAQGGLVDGWQDVGAAGSLGDRLAVAAPDTLAAPGQVSTDLAIAQASNQQVTYAPSVQVYCSDPGSSESIGLLVTQHLQSQFDSQFTPLMNTNPLGTRRDAALTDGVA